MIFTEDFKERAIIPEKHYFEKNETIEMHCHDFVEIEFLLKGEVEHIYNNNTTILKPGDCVLIVPHDFHAVHAKTDVEIWNIHCDINIIDEDITNTFSMSMSQNFFCHFNSQEATEISHCFERILSEQDSRLLFSNIAEKLLLHELIIRIIRRTDNSNNHIPNLTQKMITYVHTHFRENISLGALASQFSYTPNYTGMIFKQNTGMSFNRYLNHIRLKYACNMLRFSSFPIKDIALMAGYSSVEHFLYTFKKHIGCTPLEYRKQELSNK